MATKYPKPTCESAMTIVCPKCRAHGNWLVNLMSVHDKNVPDDSSQYIRLTCGNEDCEGTSLEFKLDLLPEFEHDHGMSSFKPINAE